MRRYNNATFAQFAEEARAKYFMLWTLAFAITVAGVGIPSYTGVSFAVNMYGEIAVLMYFTFLFIYACFGIFSFGKWLKLRKFNTPRKEF